MNFLNKLLFFKNHIEENTTADITIVVESVTTMAISINPIQKIIFL